MHGWIQQQKTKLREKTNFGRKCVGSIRANRMFLLKHKELQLHDRAETTQIEHEILFFQFAYGLPLAMEANHFHSQHGIGNS